MEEQSAHRGSLSGLVVLDLSRDLAAPLVTQVLADLGALVIKVEHPTQGDETRDWGPPFVADQSIYFLAFNRNKRAVTLDLKHPEGRAILDELLRRADVLVENFRGDAAGRLGLSPQAVREAHPHLVHLSVSGFGRTGSADARPGYDLVMQGISGLMSITGEPSGPPTRVGLPIVDILTGLYGVAAVLAALRHRDTSGEGQWIDLALHDVAISSLFNVGASFLNTGRVPARHGNAHPNLVPYQPFATRDGAVMVAVANDAQWNNLCRAIGTPDMAEDARFRRNRDRVEHREELLPRIGALFLGETTAYWEALLIRNGVPVGPLRTVPEALADPLIGERELIWNVLDQAGRSISLLASPLSHQSRTPARIAAAPPLQGQDTDWVLSTVLGYSRERVALLHSRKVV